MVRFRIRVFCLVAGGLISLTTNSWAFDEPNFARAPFSSEALPFTDVERESLVDALAALSSNFPRQPKIDSDVCERALGLALVLDPFDFSARQSFDRWVNDKPQVATLKFDSLSSVSEALWNGVEQCLRTPIEPDAWPLAAQLAELSLLIHPDPPLERVLLLGRVVNVAPDSEKGFLKLQAAQPSTLRARNLRTEAGESLATRLAAIEKAEAFASEIEGRIASSTDKGKGKAMDRSKPDPDRPPSDFDEPVVRTLSAIVPVMGPKSGVLIGGDLDLELRAARKAEYAKIGEGGYLSHFVDDEAGLPIADLDRIAEASKAQGWKIPRDAIAQYSFSTESSLPGPRRLMRGVVAAPGLVLLQSCLNDTAIRNDLVVGPGRLSSDDSERYRDDIPRLIEELKELGKPYFIVPATLHNAVLSHAIETQDIGFLFDCEWISFAAFEELPGLCSSGENPELAAAHAAFGEIKAVRDRMPSLVELARNPIVQERLEQVVDAYPPHLSAQLLLEFGRYEPSTEMMLRQSVQAIDRLIEDYFDLDASKGDLSNLKQVLEERDAALSRMRTTMPSPGRDYFDASEEFLETVERYFSVTNRGSSLDSQRLREMQAAQAVVKGARDRLAIPSE
ncbi:MAG: hypothetical protein AAF236_15395 [Verrucomicrobiota bacterium]